MVDTDGDRLLDCYETNTGTYVSPTNTGTDPTNPDTDGDGLDDGDEVLGTLGGLDLPGMGVSPVRRNILLEHDWMDDSSSTCGCPPLGAHSHRPTATAIGMVATAFANSPGLNPDGSTGITMIDDYGQGGAFTGGNLVGSDALITGGVDGAEFLAYKAANFATNRNGYFHYVLHAHEYDSSFPCSSGQAELPGDDLIVTIYNCVVFDQVVANTIMHELGHNLNLRHGGFEDCNWKPNYNSVMNYKYQFPGIDTDCIIADDGTNDGDGLLDFSTGSRPALNENALVEANGVCGAGPAVDWNCNGIINGGTIARDINRDGDGSCGPADNFACGGTLTVLSDHDDWANILLGAGVLDEPDAARVDDPSRPTLPRQRPREIVDCTNRPGMGQ